MFDKKCPTVFITAIGTRRTRTKDMIIRHIRTRMTLMPTDNNSNMVSMINRPTVRLRNSPMGDKCSRQEMVPIQVQLSDLTIFHLEVNNHDYRLNNHENKAQNYIDNRKE